MHIPEALSFAADAIMIWNYHSAPLQYTDKFPDDDCDYIAYIPNGIIPPYLDEGTRFAPCEIRISFIPNTDAIVIAGYHA